MQDASYKSGPEALAQLMGEPSRRLKAEALAAFDAEMLRLARADKARAMRGWDRQARKIREAALALG